MLRSDSELQKAIAQTVFGIMLSERLPYDRMISMIQIMNWQQMLKELFADHEAKLEQLAQKTIICVDCGEIIKFGERFVDRGDIPSRVMRPIQYYCRPCAQQAVANWWRSCMVCNTGFWVQSQLIKRFICDACRQSGYHREILRLEVQIARAKERDLPATLTIQEWIRTCNDFERLCAYCLDRPFTELEHFVPILHGGGTTAQNCLPVCAECNDRKHIYHPDDERLSIGKETLNRVRAYLATR